MSLLITLVLAVSLSMDAFSLALAYGTLNLSKKIQKSVSITVGVFHFFMPILGYNIGTLLLKIIKINPNFIVGLIFLLLGIEMILSLKKEERIKILTNIFSIIVFSFTVSIDSFSVGIGFGVTQTNILISCFIFSVVSLIFTYLGLKLGKKITESFGKIAIVIASIILIVLGVLHLT